MDILRSIAFYGSILIGVFVFLAGFQFLLVNDEGTIAPLTAVIAVLTVSAAYIIGFGFFGAGSAVSRM